MQSVEGVENVHHIHIWAISTTEYALTAHVVISSLNDLPAIKAKLKEVLDEAGIRHSTLEFEDAAHRCQDETCCQ